MAQLTPYFRWAHGLRLWADVEIVLCLRLQLWGIPLDRAQELASGAE